MMIECHIQIQAAEINNYTEKLFSCPHSLLNSTSIIFLLHVRVFLFVSETAHQEPDNSLCFLAKEFNNLCPPLLAWKKMFNPALTNNDNIIFD